MELPSYFTDFLQRIRLSEKQDFIDAHKTIRAQLETDEDVKEIFVHSFLQGSYRRSTAIKPVLDASPDIDVVLVTTIDKERTLPHDAMVIFEPFLERHYKGQWRFQGRSIGIELDNVDLDLVITAAPSTVTKELLQSSLVLLSDEVVGEMAEPFAQFSKSLKLSESEFQIQLSQSKAADPWRSEPLYIPDRDAKAWKPTDPLAQIAWTVDKNKNTNGHYINVVKALKWWHRIKLAEGMVPKGYPLEHLIGQTCPDVISGVGHGVTKALENIVQNYQLNKLIGTVPVLADHGVPEHNVFARLTATEFASFYDEVVKAAKVARNAFDAADKKASIEYWKQLFGDDFDPEDGEGEEMLASAPAVIIKREPFA